jgi:hypothetical protein
MLSVAYNLTLSVIMLSIANNLILSVIMLSVLILNAVILAHQQVSKKV